MNALAVAAASALRLAVTGETSAGVKVIRQAIRRYPGAERLLVLYMADQALACRQRVRFRMPVEDWNTGAIWASNLAQARYVDDMQRVHELLPQGTYVDMLMWAAHVVREANWVERQVSLTLDRYDTQPPQPEEEPDPDPMPATVRPCGGWIQRFDSNDWC